jgi:mannose-1-phosphate guanylyltransferase
MAGGSGTRFWPKSSAKHPKQLLALTGKKTQIQLTWDRLGGVVPAQNRWVIGTETLATAIRAQLPGAHQLKEPVGRNTMAAVCWSAWTLHGNGGDKDALVAVLPADAFVGNVSAFRAALNEAFVVAEKEDRIVCLGIKPKFPSTAYGYIQGGRPLPTAGCEIEKFTEKPPADKAQEYFQSGEYFWNAGIFVFRAGAFIDEVRLYAPAFAAFFDKAAGNQSKIKSGYKNLPLVSVDVALMENTKRGALVPGDFGWNDLGSWPALAEVLPSNDQAGLIHAPGGHAAIDCSGLIVDVTDRKFVGLIGVSDLIVVETDKALLICRKDEAQKIKDLVGSLNQNKKLKDRLL